MPLPDHLFVADNGALYDTRVSDWHKKPPLRPMFKRGVPWINNTHECKAAIRNGQYAWPGGYQMYLVCDDGAAMCFECARKDIRQILPAIQHNERNGWRVIATEINYEDSDLYCEGCSEKIPAAYGDN